MKRILLNIGFIVLVLGLDSITFAQTGTTVTPASPTVQTAPNSTAPQRILKPKRRFSRKRLTLADSLRRDSLNRLANVNPAVVPTTANNNSAFNIGQPNTQAATATALQSTGNSVEQPPSSATIATPVQPEETAKVLHKSNNPFDIVVPETTTSSAENVSANDKKVETQSLSTPATPTSSKNFLFWLFFVILVVMALIVANTRGAIQNAYSAMLNDSALRQIYKEPIGWGSLTYLSLYALAWLSIAVFAFLLCNFYGAKLPYSKLNLFFICFLLVSVLYLTRHLVLYVLANVFPVAKEVRTYNFILMTAGILTGLLLMPFNIFIAFSPTELSQLFIYGGFAVVIAAYLVRSLRGLTVATPFLMDNKFHFLLYLCAVEFAPLLVLAKLIMPYY